MPGSEVVDGGRGGTTSDTGDRWIKSLSSRERLASASKGSTPPFSESLVSKSDLEQMCPDGVTTGFVAGRPVREQV